jgi:hypothetical protein
MRPEDISENFGKSHHLKNLTFENLLNELGSGIT